MLLCIDIGNTNITVGVFEGDTLCFEGRLATDRQRTADQYAVEFRDILHIHDVSCKAVNGAVLSSVVPSLTDSIVDAVSIITGTVPKVVGPGTKTGLNIKIDNPAQLGADLVVGAVAAIKMYSLPCIIFDLGTAITISVVDKNANFLGVIIAAGVGISLDALTGRTAQLPQINIESPKSAIGTNTVDSMKSGLVYGTAAMLDGLTERIEKELGMPATLVATGGQAAEIIKNCKRKVEYCDKLLLEGLKIVYDKNK